MPQQLYGPACPRPPDMQGGTSSKRPAGSRAANHKPSGSPWMTTLGDRPGVDLPLIPRIGINQGLPQFLNYLIRVDMPVLSLQDSQFLQIGRM